MNLLGETSTVESLHTTLYPVFFTPFHCHEVCFRGGTLSVFQTHLTTTNKKFVFSSFSQHYIMDPTSDFRRSTYKERSRFKPEEVRRRRENAQVEIRKQKKEENLAKRRNFDAVGDDSEDELDGLDAQVSQ
jgi:hypothetical protein